MRRGSPGRGGGTGRPDMKRPGWRAGSVNRNFRFTVQAGTGVARASVGPVTARITPAMVARSHGLADPRWSPDGRRLGWVDSHDGRSDLVVAPIDTSTPPVVVTADTPLGGGWCWAGPDEVVVAAGDGRLLVVRVDGGEPRVLSRDGAAAAPALSARGEVAFTIDRDAACDIAVVPLDGST